MAGLNKVMLIGNLGRDPEVRYTQSGTPVSTFSVAVSERWKTPEGETRERTEWAHVVAWDKLAEVASKYLGKGSKVFVEGKLQTRSWESQDGQKRYKTEVVCNNLVLLDKKDAGEAYAPDEIEPEEIPF